MRTTVSSPVKPIQLDEELELDISFLPFAFLALGVELVVAVDVAALDPIGVIALGASLAGQVGLMIGVAEGFTAHLNLSKSVDTSW